MSQLTRNDILKLARLSRLRLTKSEIERFRVELSEILAYVEALDKVDTRGLEPTYQVTGLHSVMRVDEIKSYQAKPSDLLKGAPNTQNGYIKVKKIL